MVGPWPKPSDPNGGITDAIGTGGVARASGRCRKIRFFLSRTVNSWLSSSTGSEEPRNSKDCGGSAKWKVSSTRCWAPRFR
jgi:hypothetical protein